MCLNHCQPGDFKVLTNKKKDVFDEAITSDRSNNQWQTVIQRFLRGLTGTLLDVLTEQRHPVTHSWISEFRLSWHLNWVQRVLISESNGAQRPFTFEDYFNDSIRWKSYNLYWISGMPVEPVELVWGFLLRLPLTSPAFHIYRQRVSAQSARRERLSAQCWNERGVPVSEQFHICKIYSRATFCWWRGEESILQTNAPLPVSS